MRDTSRHSRHLKRQVGGVIQWYMHTIDETYVQLARGQRRLVQP